MSDINFCNTKEQLNHLGEVVTGKVDGSPTGADIDTSTLPYTGQVRKTLPALEDEYEQSIANKESEADVAIDEYRLTNKGPYASGITLESKFEYITYNGETYFATNPPYTTTATTPDADGNLFVGRYISQASIANYTDIVYKASGGNSAVENMILGIPLSSVVGQILSTGGTAWERVSVSAPSVISDFTPLSPVVTDDFNSILEAYDAIKLIGGEISISATTQSSSSQLVPDEPRSAIYNIKGLKRQKSRVETSYTGFLHYVNGGWEWSDLTLAQTDTGKGVAIGTNNTLQYTNSSHERMNITGFRYGIWLRYSLWNSFKDLALIGNKAGINLSRGDYQSDNSNPDNTGSWNTDWFHNAGIMSNVYADGQGGGEYGIKSCAMCYSFDAVTCQNYTSDGVDNDVLAGTQKGTGFILEAGVDGGSRDGWCNTMKNGYFENNEISMVIKDQKYFSLESGFFQGGTSSSRKEAAIKVSNSIVDFKGITGQDYFDTFLEASDNSLAYIEPTQGPLASTNKFVVDATSRIKPRGIIDANKFEYTLNKTSGTLNFILSQEVPSYATAYLDFIGRYDGFTGRFGVLKIQRFPGIAAHTSWDQDGAPSDVTVSVSASGVVTVTLGGTQAYFAAVTLRIESGRDVSGTAQDIIGA